MDIIAGILLIQIAASINQCLSFAQLRYDDSSEIFKDGSNRDDSIENKLEDTKKALSEARKRQEEIEEKRNLLLQELEESEAILQKHAEAFRQDKEHAVSKQEAVTSQLGQNLQESIEEKVKLESKFVLAKKDAFELALQVEKLSEIAFQQATSYVLEDAKLRLSAAEARAAEAAYNAEKHIRNAAEGAIGSILERSKEAIEKALTIAGKDSDHATTNVDVFADGINTDDEIDSTKNIELQNSVNKLRSQLLLSENDISKLKMQIEKSHAQASAHQLRSNEAKKSFLELQESSMNRVHQNEEEIKLLMDKLEKEAADRKQSAYEAFKVELESVRAAVLVAKKTVHSKDDIYVRRCETLQRSLKASETTSKKWKERAETAESFLLTTSPPTKEDQDTFFIANGGRLELLMNDDSLQWKLLSDGPRRKIPVWISQRIDSFCPKFPPRKLVLSESLSFSKYKTLELPKPDEIWSISHEKPKEGDVLVEHVIEKDIIDDKRSLLDRILQRKTTQWQKTPELKKLEPGTGTGHEIVFQAFNWESWRRQWYVDLAPKAADLSQCGVTSVWFPPPTESVAPQGYMPSDLYNLNSAYGTEEELKHCIEEMHNHGLVALGDVVLNHRCAHKQSPNGVWNIFGGKLAWGPEAIVCDDPNFQGRGNPSSGDIFHAAPNVDHSQGFVRNDIKEWLQWLRDEIGFDGWRLDFARGFSGGYVKEYIESSNPAFSIGEYWDSLAYEGGNLCYNQDAHRQRIINWINATGGTSSAFDVTTKGILHHALHNEFWRLIDPQGKPTGVMGWWPSRAVTFLENHDTGSTQGHWPFPREKLPQGYAYILTHPGTPTLFYDHYYDFGLREVINELVDVRRRAGVSCRSSVKIFHANNEGYVAQVGDTLVVKLGYIDWNPSKEIHLEGTWNKFLDKAQDYQIWFREDVLLN
ncbi:uncharacterized protein LOC124916150 [Impatiens glandulifera]|uniref:uncharacterized protein LOC124916150 n=1 Tax=Impatiens glandulifera TaxID=253017 RepID=UPI001FB18578|nr:uncharacterized protein LOC124916150 [Impatiens glandulifera]